MTWHPFVIHLPIAFALFAPVLGLGLFWLGIRAPELRRSWIMAVLWHLVMSMAVYAAMFTGEQAEERPDFPAAAKAAVHEHEERAELFFLLSLAAIPLAVAGVKTRQTWPRIVLIAYQFALMGLCIYVGYLGGQITHG